MTPEIHAALRIGGWMMPEVGEVREGRVWTGSEWISLKSGSNDSSKAEPPSDESTTTPKNGTTVGPAACPVCKKDDRLTRVSGLVDSSTQATSGSATTFAAGISTGGIGVGAGRTRLQATTETRLAERLKAPPLSGGTRWKPILIAFAFIVPAVLIITQDGSKPLPIVLLAGLLMLIGGYFILAAKLEDWLPSRHQVSAWNEGHEQLRSAFYCERDDVVFLPEAQTPLSPEELVEQAFQPFAEAPRRRFSPW